MISMTTAEKKENVKMSELTKNRLESYKRMLLESKNLIFRGAPGTGKTYLAKEIAAYIISNGSHSDFSKLDDNQKKQIEFVQFHPNYDYTDFVEGLRPIVNEDGTMGFELRDGIFKKFVARARTNFENAKKDQKTVDKESSVQGAMHDFIADAVESGNLFETSRRKNKFKIRGVEGTRITIDIPNNEKDTLYLNLDIVRKMLESDNRFVKVQDVSNFVGTKWPTQHDSYYFVIYNKIKDEIKDKKSTISKGKNKREGENKYIFIIDEINRGEISKILGELFYAIDPGYRGKSGEISTQYSNLHFDPDEKFYIPDNMYIIGTMNDIDRSVDSFDFAMRRRFRFVEIRANERLEMLASLKNKDEVIKRMSALNKEIASIEDLNENYQIGASYFLKLETMTFEQLWEDCLQPLLQEYTHGMYDEKGIMKRFADAYGYQHLDQDDSHETD